MPLEPGEPAPQVTLPNQHGEPTTPAIETLTVLYFYPEDGTPGCTTETQQFVLEYDTYQEAGVTVYGISTDSVAEHAAFSAAHDVPFELLADPEGEAIEAYGVARDPSDRAVRTTFVVDGGEVVDVYEGVDPDGHPREIMMDLLDSGHVEL